MRALLPLLLLGPAGDALACGQSTHVWIGIEAHAWLPDGELKALLGRPELFGHRVNGAMFPDGGYSPITQDGYGETAHWEPFQTAYLHWIRERFEPPYTTGEAAEHVAFLMGLAAHGMADQIYDGVYLTRSLLYDGEETWRANNVDLTTDVMLTAALGPVPEVDDVVPYDALADVFDRYGQPTEVRTMTAGQTSLRLAVRYVGNVGQDPAEVAAYEPMFPWAHGNLLDPAVPCSPACIQPAVAAYWQTIWDRLHDRFDPDAHAVFATWPADGAFDHPRDATSIEAQVSLGLSRAVDLASLTEDRVTVVDASGAPHPIGFRMYYRDGSNVLNVWPLEDWAEDEDYELTLHPGVRSFDGVALSRPWSMRFSTRAAPPEARATGCAGGCRTGGGPTALALLGLLALRRRR